ncbi:putative charged multivesicular body protein 4B-like protein CHMP4BP1 isoform X1 [Chiloscyllium punctatum]|uniref:putative charged multivesicular body protein 4B-like protein CHMP4BP1 isoform X1 n=1 Tax=Chiloscyllium punctatum TaxID=137246 RepID=UPI003B63B70F
MNNYLRFCSPQCPVPISIGRFCFASGLDFLLCYKHIFLSVAASGMSKCVRKESRSVAVCKAARHPSGQSGLGYGVTFCYSVTSKLCSQEKKVALQALKRKKRLEKQLAQIDGTLSTIEFQREALENANTNTEVLKSMGYAAKAIKAVHENIDLDKIDMMMQDITEQQEIAQEISDAISHPAAFGSEFDEDELLAELEELEEEELSKKMTKVMPKVPTTSLPSRQVKSKKTTREEDAGMKHLKAWAL